MVSSPVIRHGSRQGPYNRRMHADEFDRLQVGEHVLYHEGFTPYRLWPGTVVVRQQLLRRQPLLGIGVPGLGRIVYPSARHVHRDPLDVREPCSFCQATRPGP